MWGGRFRDVGVGVCKEALYVVKNQRFLARSHAVLLGLEFLSLFVRSTILFEFDSSVLGLFVP